MSVSASAAYTPIPSIVLDDGEHQAEQFPEEYHSVPQQSGRIALAAKDKWRLVRPLLGKFMLPLCESNLPLF
jgi:battenin